MEDIYRHQIADALAGAMEGLAKVDGVTMPSLMGAIVISVHQSTESGGPLKLHIATNLSRSQMSEALRPLGQADAADKLDKEGYASV